MSARSPAILVSELFPPAVGGSAWLFGELYARLADLPARVITDRARSGGERPARLARLPVVCWELATPHWGLLTPKGWPHHLRMARELGRVARAEAGILHCGRVLPEGLWAWLAHHRYGVPFVCWSHGEDATAAQSSREYALIMPRIYGAAAVVLANSFNTGRILREQLRVPAQRIVVAQPGVDPHRFGPGVDGIAVRERLHIQNRFVLLTVARVERRKGHDLVIRAVAKLVAAGLHDLHYVVVGTGSDVDRLRRLAADCGITSLVTFVGAVSDAELPAFYAACDVFVHANRMEGSDIEGFGLVFLEAAAAERPAIGGNSGGVPETMVPGVTGLLVSGTDVDELAEAIRGLAADRARAAAIGRAARLRAVAECSWDQSAAIVARAHEQVASRPDRGDT